MNTIIHHLGRESYTSTADTSLHIKLSDLLMINMCKT